MQYMYKFQNQNNSRGFTTKWLVCVLIEVILFHVFLDKG